MSKFFFLIAILSLSSVPALAAVDWNAPKKKEPHKNLACNYFLTHVPVVFEGDGVAWRKTYSAGSPSKVIGDTANVVAVELGRRGMQNDYVTVRIGNDPAKTPQSFHPFSRLDALLIDNQDLFQDSIMDAVVTRGDLPVLKARIEKFEINNELSRATLHQVIVDMSSKILSVETKRKSLPNLAPYLLIKAEIDKVNHQLYLYTEADSMIFLAGQKLRLRRLLLHLLGLEDRGATNAYAVIAGSTDRTGVKALLPRETNIGSEYKIIGVEQVRLERGTHGLTHIFVTSKHGLVSRMVAKDYDTGLRVLETVLGASNFTLKVTQQLRPAGNGLGEEWTNVFEIPSDSTESL